MKHVCHAHNCNAPVPPRMLFCRPHWFSLRRAVQEAIWREYRPGQETDKRPSLRYMAVQRLAVSESAANEAARKLFLVEANLWRQRAIDAGLGDPLEGLVEEKRRVG